MGPPCIMYVMADPDVTAHPPPRGMLQGDEVTLNQPKPMLVGTGGGHWPCSQQLPDQPPPPPAPNTVHYGWDILRQGMMASPGFY